MDDRNTMRSLRVLDEVLQGLPASIAAGLKLNGIFTVERGGKNGASFNRKRLQIVLQHKTVYLILV